MFFSTQIHSIINSEWTQYTTSWSSQDRPPLERQYPHPALFHLKPLPALSCISCWSSSFLERSLATGTPGKTSISRWFPLCEKLMLFYFVSSSCTFAGSEEQLPSCKEYSHLGLWKLIASKAHCLQKPLIFSRVCQQEGAASLDGFAACPGS